ncbi:hypothetical protein AAFF_G00154420 [Aldrovandia affinis]|uniref:Uncharacterized protein n=1 Tax=Aldrovandia affinis TaxID=143900 RepID=A0AAD7SZU3_9TELE|nr:hypothetical protein AAFF_G00154420 [Aldrovandia affinis]
MENLSEVIILVGDLIIGFDIYFAGDLSGNTSLGTGDVKIPPTAPALVSVSCPRASIFVSLCFSPALSQNPIQLQQTAALLRKGSGGARAVRGLEPTWRRSVAVFGTGVCCRWICSDCSAPSTDVWISWINTAQGNLEPIQLSLITEWSYLDARWEVPNRTHRPGSTERARYGACGSEHTDKPLWDNTRGHWVNPMNIQIIGMMLALAFYGKPFQGVRTEMVSEVIAQDMNFRKMMKHQVS